MIYIIEIDCICLFTLIFILRSMRRKSGIISSTKYLYHAGYYTMAVIVSDILSLLLSNGHLGILNNSIIFNYIINMVYYYGSVCASFMWFVHVEYTIDSVIWSKRRNILIALIPSHVSFILTLTTPLTGAFFTITSDNVYVRGPLFFINNIVCYLYAFNCCGHALVASYKTGDYMKKKQYRLLACYIVFPVLFALIQTFKPEIPTILIGMTVPIVYIYTELLNMQISTDYLTGLNNRNQLMRFLDGALKNPDKEKTIFLFLIDVDSFKKINDTYGHNEGDAALQKTADILRATAKNFGGMVARLGGDEFTFVTELDSYEDAEKVKQFIEAECKTASEKLDYTLALSVGCGRYTEGLKASELLLLADSDMYKEKTIRKKLRGV